MVLNESIRDSNEFKDLGAKRKLSHTAKSTSVPYVNMMLKQAGKPSNLFTSQFNGEEGAMVSEMASMDARDNVK